MDILNFLRNELNPPALGSEKCSLLLAGGRVLASGIISLDPVPGYDESTRDGYALGAPLGVAGNSYKLNTDEAFAGNTRSIALNIGQACHVMTGGLIPVGTHCVVPKELATVFGGMLLKVCDLGSLPDFIKRCGSEFSKGQPILEKGTILKADHLASLAQIGNETVDVYKRPRVGILATGSELVELGDELAPGLKIASNKYLLSQLCSSFGADVVDLGIVGDKEEDLTEFFSTLMARKFDVIVTTGGMGPGKYDLLETSFCSVGGRMITNSLPLSPGKSTLVGWLSDTLFFGLPGNPSAVHPLFVELIAPGLLAMQGVQEKFPNLGKAILQTGINAKQASHTALLPGVLGFQGITRVVRFAKKSEVANCYILVEPDRHVQAIGTVAMVHEVASPFSQ